MSGGFISRSALFGATLVIASSATAQTPAPAAEAPWDAPAIGSMAPDFSLTGATRYGVLDAPVRLSDYKGKTVVLAFFFKARTKG